MHAKHHSNDVKAPTVHGRRVEPNLANDVEVFYALGVAVLDVKSRIKDPWRAMPSVASATSSASTRAHGPISTTGLVDTDLCRVETDVQLYRLRSLLPLVQVAAFAASNVKNEQFLAA